MRTSARFLQEIGLRFQVMICMRFWASRPKRNKVFRELTFMGFLAEGLGVKGFGLFGGSTGFYKECWVEGF